MRAQEDILSIDQSRIPLLKNPHHVGLKSVAKLLPNWIGSNLRGHCFETSVVAITLGFNQTAVLNAQREEEALEKVFVSHWI